MAIYFVATNGNNSNSGSQGSPWLTPQYGISQMVPGDILYVRGGIYAPVSTIGVGDNGNHNCGIAISGKNGNSTDKYQLLAYPGENPIIIGDNLAANNPRAGILLSSSSYWLVKGFEIRDIYQSSVNRSGGMGLQIYSGHHNQIELIKSHHNGGAGFLTRVPSGDDNKFINCDAYYNYDPYSNTPGDDADGFDLGFGASFYKQWLIGCRSFDNSDDGFDFYQYTGYHGIYYIINCWAFRNGWIPGTNTRAGDGNGFKYGADGSGPTATTERFTYNSIAWGNRQRGFSQESANVRKSFFNNIASRNGSHGFSFIYFDTPDLVYNNISFGNDGDDVEALGSSRASVGNSWDAATGVTASDADFVSVDDSQLENPRQSDGTLPLMTFLHLKDTSDLIEAGNVIPDYYGSYIPGQNTDGDGVLYNTPPSLGPFEFDGSNVNLLIEGLQIIQEHELSVIDTYHGTLQLTADVSPTNATNQTLLWSVINGSGTATVTQTGLVSALSNGTVTIRVSAQDGSGIYAEYALTLSNQTNVIINPGIPSMAEIPTITEVNVTGTVLDIFNYYAALIGEILQFFITELIQTINSVSFAEGELGYNVQNLPNFSAVVNDQGELLVNDEDTSLYTVDNNGELIYDDVLEIPEDLTFTENPIVLQWASVNNALGYQLDISKDSQFHSYIEGYQNVDVGNVLSFIVLLSKGVYFCRVRAYNNIQLGFAQTLELNINLSIPIALPASNISANIFTANWEAVLMATGYYIDIADDEEFTNILVENEDVGNVLSYVPSITFDYNTTYYYRVRAYDNESTTNNSNTINLTTLATTPIKYGKLYTFPAVTDVRSIANEGWHVPTYAELNAFYIALFLGANGGKLKDTDSEYWLSPNTGATNEYFFNARGAGVRSANTGEFIELKERFYLRTTTPDPIYGSLLFTLAYNTYSAGWNGSGTTSASAGASVRLVKDSTTLSEGESGLYIGNDGKIYPTICLAGYEFLASNLAETKYKTNLGANDIDEWYGSNWDTFLTDGGANLISVISTNPNIRCLAESIGKVIYAAGRIFKITINLTLNSGVAPRCYISNGNTTVTVPLGLLVNGVNEFTFDASVLDWETGPAKLHCLLYNGNLEDEDSFAVDFSAECAIQELGDDIPEVTSNSLWIAVTEGLRCSYDNDVNND